LNTKPSLDRRGAREPGFTDLVQTSLPRADVERTASDYLAFHDEDAGGSLAGRRAHYARMVNNFYDLVTDFYEFGWGPSFHFAPRHRGESLSASIARHEFFLASRLGLRPGLTVLDVGCGCGGPMRAMARFSGASIVGINNNDYQIARSVAHTRTARLTHLCSHVKGDFMAIAPGDGPYDAVYAIEASCHAPDKAELFRVLAAVMKPGALFASYEWCLTPRYDPSNAEHRAIKRGIEDGDALPELPGFDVVHDALATAGLELLEHRDRAAESDPETPWYQPLAARFALRGFHHSRAGRAFTNVAVRALERVRIAPRGSAAVSTFLNAAAEAIVRGGETGVFTPMYYVLARKPC
jgi:sterol 24-C-methyltransferase